MQAVQEKAVRRILAGTQALHQHRYDKDALTCSAAAAILSPTLRKQGGTPCTNSVCSRGRCCTASDSLITCSHVIILKSTYLQNCRLLAAAYLLPALAACWYLVLAD